MLPEHVVSACAHFHPVARQEGRTVTIGFSPAPAKSSRTMNRSLDLAEWSSLGVPLLRDPRGVIKGLLRCHPPDTSTALLAVLDPEGRLVASASFAQRPDTTDGWDHRNALLWHLRRVIPHDLRRQVPVRTCILVLSREGDPGWSEGDGAWMWGLRDACALHGLRCGAYVTLTPSGWQVLGEGRGGRTPHSCPWLERPVPEASVFPGNGTPSVLRAAAR